jgi:hypothetical protein
MLRELSLSVVDHVFDPMLRELSLSVVDHVFDPMLREDFILGICYFSVHINECEDWFRIMCHRGVDMSNDGLLFQ